MKGFAAGRWVLAASMTILACATGENTGISFEGGLAGSGASSSGGGPSSGGAPGGAPQGGGGTQSGGTGAVGGSGGIGASGGTGGVSGSGASGGSGGTGSSSGGAPPDSSVPDASTPDSSTGGVDAGAFGDCCTSHTAPGCSVNSIKQCVCNIDGTCCSLGWNANCVKLAAQYGCAACPDGGIPGSGGTGGGTAGGDCCFSKSTPGCSNPTVQNCVCLYDSYCCQYSWDSICAGEVTDLGCGTC